MQDYSSKIKEHINRAEEIVVKNLDRSIDDCFNQHVEDPVGFGTCMVKHLDSVEESKKKVELFLMFGNKYNQHIKSHSLDQNSALDRLSHLVGSSIENLSNTQ